MLAQQVDAALRAEQPLPGQHLEDQHAAGVEVGATVDRVAEDLLRRDVARGTDDGPGLGEAGVCQRGILHLLGDAEVHQLHQVSAVTQRAYQHVGRLEVAVHHVVLVHFLQGREDLPADLDDARERNGARAPQQLSQVLAVDQLEHQVQASVRELTQVEHRHHVGVPQPRQNGRFPLEALEHLWIGGQRGVNGLDTNGPFEPGVLGAEDLAQRWRRGKAVLGRLTVLRTRSRKQRLPRRRRRRPVGRH